MCDFFPWNCSDPPPLPQSCCERRCALLSEVYCSLSFEVFLLKSHLSWLFMVLEAALDFFFFLNRYFKKITYLPYITRNLEVGNHLHGFMNSTLTGTASVQLFRTSLRWPGGAAPTIISVFTGWWGRRSRGEELHQFYLCVYWEGYSFPRLSTTNCSLGLTVKSWAPCRLYKIRILLERKNVPQNIACMVSVPNALMMALWKIRMYLLCICE